MLRSLRRFSFIGVVLLSVVAFCLLPAWAKDKQANDYPLSGKVLSSSSKGAHAYQVETESRIYLMLCERVKGFHMSLPECKVDDRPITDGDTVRFRVDGDFAFMPVAKGAEDGLRILTTELKVIPPLPPATAGEKSQGSKDDERDLVLKGYVAFLDPPKTSAGRAIDALHKHGVGVKILTGDNDLISRKVCRDVGLSADPMLLGADIEKMSDPELADATEKTALFARLSPAHK